MLRQYSSLDLSGLSLPTLPERVSALLLDNGRPRTREHVLAVSETARALARRFGCPEEAPVRAGLLHDIAALLSPREMMAQMTSLGAVIDEAERLHPFLLHQRVSRIIAREDFGVADEETLSAIECHTTLRRTPSRTDLIVYLADKISWDQPGEPPWLPLLEEALDHSLERAAWVHIRDSLEKGRILHPHRWLLEALDSLPALVEEAEGRPLKGPAG